MLALGSSKTRSIKPRALANKPIENEQINSNVVFDHGVDRCVSTKPFLQERTVGAGANPAEQADMENRRDGSDCPWTFPFGPELCCDVTKIGCAKNNYPFVNVGLRPKGR